jgi:DNA-binding XRE family transcriptional regulator
MNYGAIHQALKDCGYSWRVAAEAIGCTPQHLMNISARRSESQFVARALAALIGKEVEDIFPDIPRYQFNKQTLHDLKVLEAKNRLAESGIVTMEQNGVKTD